MLCRGIGALDRMLAVPCRVHYLACLSAEIRDVLNSTGFRNTRGYAGGVHTPTGLKSRFKVALTILFVTSKFGLGVRRDGAGETNEQISCRAKLMHRMYERFVWIGFD